MATNNRIIETDQAKDMLIRFISNKKPPFTVSITDGKHRTNDQNRLQRRWLSEIAEQLGDRTAEEVRGECKLTFGVPILLSENEAFRFRYEEVVASLPYETRLKLMMEPISLPITSIMNTKQKTAYLDAIHRHYSGMGIVLTNPEDMKWKAA